MGIWKNQTRFQSLLCQLSLQKSACDFSKTVEENCVYMMPFSDRKSVVWLSLSLHSDAHADITNQSQTLSQSRQQLLFPDIRFRGAQNSSKHCSDLTLFLLGQPSLGHWTIFVSGTSIQEDFSSVNTLHFPFKIPALLSGACQSLLVATVYFF